MIKKNIILLVTAVSMGLTLTACTIPGLKPEMINHVAEEGEEVKVSEPEPVAETELEDEEEEKLTLESFFAKPENQLIAKAFTIVPEGYKDTVDKVEVSFKENRIPRWLQIYKYMTTICLTVTFLVVIFILGPMYKFDYEFLLFSKELFLYHVVCPILAFITFTKYDDIKPLTIVDNFIGLTISFVYSVVMIILNLLNKVTGPYPFLKVKEQTISISIAWGICMFSISYMIALFLRYLVKKNYDKIQRLKHKTKEKVKKIVKRKKEC